MKWPEYIKSFSEALIMVVYDLKFYILTEEWFYVQNGIMMDKIKVSEIITEKTDLQQTLFKYMRNYNLKK